MRSSRLQGQAAQGSPGRASVSPTPEASAALGGLALAWCELGPELGLWLPARPDDALEDLDEATFRATDERMPYWATLWPAGERLARRVLAGPSLAGRRVLDLGSGVGVCGLAAARRGARVVALDWEPRAAALIARSAEAQGLQGVRPVVADWRRPPADLGRFDLVLAADVLYEARNVAPVASFFAAHLASAGEAWIADPGRPHAAALETMLEDAGLRIVAVEALPPTPAGVEVVCHVVRRRDA